MTNWFYFHSSVFDFIHLLKCVVLAAIRQWTFLFKIINFNQLIVCRLVVT